MYKVILFIFVLIIICINFCKVVMCDKYFFNKKIKKIDVFDSEKEIKIRYIFVY